jgi:uncharacterized repeat protein (TIGR01451 family)
LLAVACAALVAAVTLVWSAGRASAAAGPPFDPATPTVFVAHGTPTIQLSKAVESNGTLVFQDIGGPQPQYNGIGYDTVNNYLYGINLSTAGGIPVDDIIQVGSDGVPNDTGVNLPNATVIGAWDPANDNVYFVSNNAGVEALQPFDPATNTLGTPVPVSGGALPPDLTYAQGYFWGWGTGQITRVNPATGVITTFPGTSSLFPNCFGAPACGGAGADWTYGNGNLGFNENQGEIYQISITNGGSANPTFKLISQQPGPASGNIDGAANPGLPTDLVMHKTASSQIPDGGKVTYTFTVTNNGPGDSSGYTISDPLPAGLSNPTTTSTGCSIANDTVTCVSANPLAHGQTSAPVTVTGTVPNPFVTPITNTATVTANEADPDPTNNSSSITSTPQADLSIDKTASSLPVVPGTNETYTLTAKNNGPDTALNATVSDPLPAGLVFVSASSGCTFASGTVTCPVGNMAPGATKTYTVTATVPSSDTDSTITNTASISSPTPDPNPDNNHKKLVVPLNPQSSLQITKTASAPQITAGGQVMYTLVVSETGPSDAHGVKVSEVVPAGLSLVSAHSSQGSCSGSACDLGTISAGGQAQILVTANVAASAGGQTLTNCATVVDSASDKGAGCAPIVVPPPPAPPQPVSDLRIVKHANHAKVVVGQTITYTMTVTNHGPDAARDAKITDTPSLALKVLSAKPSRGKCAVGKVLRCSLGTIGNRKKVTITVKAKVNQVGTERNAASATSASKDPKPANNLSKVSAKVAKKTAVLHLRKIASSRSVTAGDRITYRIKVWASQAAAHNVKVCDALPLGLSFTGSAPKAKLSRGKECWTIKTLGTGKSRTITIHARALKGTSGRKTNHATATAKGAKGARAAATVRVRPAPKPPATPVTG